MAKIYASTDSHELRDLFSRKYTLSDYDTKEGQKLACDIGFNPMSKIDVPDERDISTVVSELLKNNLFATVDDGKSIIRYWPIDYEFKNKLLQISSLKPSPFYECIFRYSINPNKIDPCNGIPRRNKFNLFRPWKLKF